MEKQLKFLILLLFLFIASNKELCSQSSNPCGVVASIYPSSQDSVVTMSNAYISFASTSVNAASVHWLINGFYSGVSSPVFNYGINPGVTEISLVAVNGNCSDTTTVVYFNPGEPHNTDSVMYANYGYANSDDYGLCVNAAADSGLFLGGYRALPNNGEEGVLVKTSSRGCIDWSLRFRGDGQYSYVRVRKVLEAPDSSVYALVGAGRDILMRFDKYGHFLWQRQWELPVPGNFGIAVFFSEVTVDNAGNFYGTAGAINNGTFIAKVDPAGNMLWARYFTLSHYNFTLGAYNDLSYPTGLLWNEGKLYVNGYAITDSMRQHYSYVMQLDPQTGTKGWNYFYSDDAGGPGKTSVVFGASANLDTLLLFPAFSQGPWATLIDPQGNVRKVIRMSNGQGYIPRKTIVKADQNGFIYTMQWAEQTLPLQPLYSYHTSFTKIDTQLNKYWGLTYSDYYRGYFTDAVLDKKNRFSGLGKDYGKVDDGVWANTEMKLIRIDTVVAGPDLNCNFTDNAFTAEYRTLNRYNFQWGTDSLLQPVAVNPWVVHVLDGYTQSRFECPDFLDSCSYIKINGPVSACNYNQDYTYKYSRNRKCALTPDWQIPQGVTVLTQTDTSITVRFPGYGSFNIGVSLKSCIPVKDSLIVVISPKNSFLSLGNDTSMCNNTSVVLHAGPAFLNYNWSTGSADSVLAVTQPGLYWVQVTDSCGGILRDSIVISLFNPVIIPGADDRVKCNADTLHLHAPPGYSTYQWSAGTTILPGNNADIVVNPLQDTVYFLRAGLPSGCYAYDTIRIFVKTSPPVDLGTDTSICAGTQLLLNAGPGFVQYVWNTGSTQQQVQVISAGEFSVTGITADGCRSADTIRVLNVWPQPQINLGKRDGICRGTVVPLFAGNFATYLWQDGSVNSTLQVSDTGLYHVMVTDVKQCAARDTVHIARFFEPPAGFLGSDTALCSYGSLDLRSLQVFTAYLWNTGAITPALTVLQPGIYILSVTDQNGCAGKDSVTVVLKECLKGFYIPSAFTPNNDGLNDLFRPVMGGNIIKYQFSIYNRYGQQVFAASQPGLGWNGQFRGVNQEANVYVFTCRYQLAGEKEKIAKGTFMLIR